MRKNNLAIYCLACLCNLHAIRSKIVNFLKSLGLPKKELNKIGLMYHYENINI